MAKVLITGVFGFIGSYLTKHILTGYPEFSVVGVGRNTTQKNMARLEGFTKNPKLNLVYLDFSKDDLSGVFQDVEYVFHCGALTFVDRSISNPLPFIQSNIIGTCNMLEEARKSRTLKRYFQVSTDEVYGQILSGSYKEDAPTNPRNPYAFTKSSADEAVKSYHNTYGLPTIITRTENNYGPYQGAEKAIPTFVRKALLDEPLPVYGDGKHRRMWLHVRDHCRALVHLIDHGEVGEIYHVAGEQELENIELARRILKILKKPEDMIRLVPDHNIRPGHDRRYALNVEKLKATGWAPSTSLDEGLRETVLWYEHNEWWLE